MPLHIFLILLSFNPTFQLTYSLKENLHGFPRHLYYETIYGNKDYSGGRNASIDYNLKVHGYNKENAFFIIASKDIIDQGIYCIGDKLYSAKNDPSQLRVVSFVPKDGLTVKGSFNIEHSNLYTDLLVSCKAEIFELEMDGDSVVTIDGTISFINHYGYLPAHKYRYIHTYALLSIVFGVAFYFWLKQCYTFKQNLFMYHHCITLLLVLSFIEMLINTCLYYLANVKGHTNMFSYNFAKLCLIGRKTLSRVLILLICCGVGIMRPQLQKWARNTIQFMSFFYFIINAITELHRANMFDENYSGNLVLLTVFLGAMDSIFFVLVFCSLYFTITMIEKEDEFKKNIYLRLTKISIFGCLIAIFFSLLELNYVSERTYLTESGWKIYWIYDFGIWEFLFCYFLFSAFCILSPSIEISKYKQVLANDIEKQSITREEEDKTFEKLISSDDNDYSSHSNTESTELSSDTEKTVNIAKPEILDAKLDAAPDELNKNDNSDKNKDEISVVKESDKEEKGEKSQDENIGNDKEEKDEKSQDEKIEKVIQNGTDVKEKDKPDGKDIDQNGSEVVKTITKVHSDEKSSDVSKKVENGQNNAKNNEDNIQKK